jgi:hypothetical protein
MSACTRGPETVLDPLYVFDQCEERLVVPRVMGTARLILIREEADPPLGQPLRAVRIVSPSERDSVVRSRFT